MYKELLQNNIDKKEYDSLIKIALEYYHAGYELYLVGGALRDLILGKEVKDLDIATNAPLEVTKRLFKKIVATGEDHGTLTILEGGFDFEVTRYRKDVATDGRNATIAFAETIEEDLDRRDFTINGMALNLINGKFIDLFGGLKDLRDKKLNFIGNAKDRILEDHLRSIRLLRFMIRYDFTTEQSSINHVIELTNMDKISPERIVQEFKKIFSYRKGIPNDLILDTIINIGLFEKYDLKVIDRQNLIKCFEINDLLPLVEQKYIASKKNMSEVHKSMKIDKERYTNFMNLIDTFNKYKNSKYLYHELMVKHRVKNDLKLIFEYCNHKFDESHYESMFELPLNVKDLNIDGNDLIQMDIIPKDRGVLLNKLLRCVWENPTFNKKDKLVGLIDEIQNGNKPSLSGNSLKLSL